MNIQSIINSKYFKQFLVVVYVVVVLVICRFAKKDAYYDFDIMMYTACVINNENMPDEQLHKQTYDLVKKELGEKKFLQLTDSNNYYRHSVYTSVANFKSQLPLYTIKPLYVTLLSIAYRCGFSPFLFSIYINLFSYLAVCAILLIYLNKRLPFYKAYFASATITLLPIVLDSLKSNTPDMLSALFILLSFILLSASNKRNHCIAIATLCLSIFIRPENIIFIYAFCGVMFICKAEFYSKKTLVLLFSLATICYLFNSFYYNSYPWSILYKHSFKGQMPNLQDQSATISLKDYIKGYYFIPKTMFYSDFILILFFITYALMNTYERMKQHSLFYLGITLIITILIRLVLYPDVSSRYTVSIFIVSALLFFSSLEKEKTSKLGA